MDAIEAQPRSASASRVLPRGFRAAAVLPVLFFALTAVDYVRDQRPDDLLWLCNICNPLLSVGLALEAPGLIWMTTLWLLIGTPLWIMDDWSTGELHKLAFMTHVVSAGLGLLALRRLSRGGVSKARAVWWQAILLLAAAQAASRLLTRPELNVNVSFAPYGQLAGIFGTYWTYWAINVAVFSLGLFLLERILDHAWLKGRRG